MSELEKPPTPYPAYVLLPPVFQALKASQAVKDIVGTNPPRIYRHGSAPQDVTSPYITWFLVAGIAENNVSDTPPFDRMSVQVDAWHPSDSGVELLALAIRDALELYAISTQILIDDFETETRLFRIAQQFDWLLDRPA
jgi:hypothetical protein